MPWIGDKYRMLKPAVPVKAELRTPANIQDGRVLVLLYEMSISSQGPRWRQPL